MACSKPEVRERIVSEGRRLLLDPHRGRLTIKGLMTAVGMSVGSFYNYFDSREDLAEAVLDQGWDELLARIDSIAETDVCQPLPDRLMRVAEAFGTHRDSILKVLSEVPVDNELSDDRRDDSLRAIHEKVRALMLADVDDEGALALGGMPVDIVASLFVEHLVASLVYQAVPDRQFIDDLFEDLSAHTSDAERNLRRRVARYDRLLDDGTVCVVRASMQDGFPVEWINEAAMRTIGYSRMQYEARFGWMLERYFEGRPEELAHMRADMEAALAAGRATFDILSKVPSRTGSIWVRGTGLFDSRDAETGKPTSLTFVFTDISGVMETNTSLRDAEARALRADALESENRSLHDTVDGVPSGIAVLKIDDGRERYLALNSYFVQRIDIAGNRLEGEAIQDYYLCIHPDDRARCRAEVRRFIAHGGFATEVFRLRRRDSGGYYWVQVRGQMVDVPGDGQIAYFVFSDIDELMQTQQDLSRSRLLYQTATRSAGLILWEYDIARHRITMSDDEVTRHACDVLGWKSVVDGVPGSFGPLVDNESMCILRDLYQEVDASRDATADVWYRGGGDREPRCIRITYIVDASSAGVPTRAFGMGQDITAEKKIEERYLREQDFLQNNSDNSLVSKGHYNLTKNQVIEYTVKDEGMYRAVAGTTYDDAVDDFLAFPYAPSEREALSDRLSRENLIRRYQHGEMKSSIEYRRMMGDAAPAWISMTIHTYMMPATGDVECFTYAYDVTARHLASQVVSHLGMVGCEEVTVIDTKSGASTSYQPNVEGDSNVEYAGGYHSLIEKSVECHVAPEDRPQVLAAVRLDTVMAALETQPMYSYAFDVRDDSGVPRRKEMRFTWQSADHDMIVSFLLDVTEQVEAERRRVEELSEAKLDADRANEAKSSFLSSMSHDLRQPLNGVIGFADLALREEDPTKKQDYLHKIDSSAQLLLALVNDTLDLSRIESGKMAWEPQVVEPGCIGPATIDALRPMAEQRGVTIEAGPFLQDALYTDGTKLQKIWLNLVSNAIKYTPRGGTVRAYIETLDEPVAGCNRRIVVADTGIGMSKSFQEKMFEPFAQELRPEAAGIQGTGLGLAIVKRIVDLAGGSIDVESDVGKGTRFEVLLPIPVAAEGAAIAERRRETVSSLEGMRVLLCEDNDMNIEIASMLLKERGVAVTVARDGAEGVEAFRRSVRGEMDAILMDVRMPRMDGREAARAIRALDRPDAKTVPIIAMSADAFGEDMRKNTEAGMNDSVSKPIDRQRLYEVLARCRRDESSV